MSLWSPFAFNVYGDALPLAAPPELRVYDGVATEKQLAYAQSVFAVFCEGMRMSYVANPTEQGRLPDGSPYQIIVVGNTTIMQLWLEPGIIENYVAVGGVLRTVGGVVVETSAGDVFEYKEFKENGEKVYANTKKLFAEPENSGLNDLVWRTFARGNLSGPAAKLAQFARGCTAAYTAYYKSRLMSLERSLGDGVVIFDDGENKKAFCYGHPSEDSVRAIAMTIAPLSDFPGVKLPDDINALFGGVPIPPSNQEWREQSNTLFTNAELRSLVEAGLTNVLMGSPMFFPSYATTGTGRVAYFITGYLDRTGKPADSKQYTHHSALAKVSFYNNAGRLDATLSVVEKGMIDHTLPENELPLGETTGPIGVTHVSGQLTVFSRRMSIRKWKFKIDEGGAVQEQTKLVRSEVMWADESVVTFFLPGLSVYEGTFTGSRSIASIGTSTDEGPPGTINTYTLWKITADFSGSFHGKYPSENNLGDVQSFGREGIFLVSRRKKDEFISIGYSATGGYTSSVIKHLVNSSGWWGTNDFPDLNPAGYFVDYNSSTVFYGDVAVGINGLAYKLPSRPDKNAWDTFSVTNLATSEAASYISSIVYAGGLQFAIDAMEVLREYETAQYVDDLMDGGTRFAYAEPLQFIRPRKGRNDVVKFDIAASHLGGPQVVAKLFAYSTKHGTEHSYSQCRGSLVDTEFDNAYDAAIGVVFVGELQP